MNPDAIEGICVLVCFAFVFVFSRRLRRNKFVYITDYQTGLRFPNGASCRVLSPGGHRSSSQSSPITVVDMRPHQFLVERVMSQDVLHANSVVSIAGELAVCDPMAAVGSLKNLADDSVAIIREGVRPAASRTIVDPTAEGRTRLAITITSELNRELGPRGVEIRNLEITELWAVPVKHGIPAEAN